MTHRARHDVRPPVLASSVGAVPDHDGMGDFDAGAYLPRARRRADVSQRELAMTLGVGQSTVARWEAGATLVPLHHLVHALELAGLHLAVVDEHGTEVPPFPGDAVRDNAGRRFPAHLDVDPPGPQPVNRGVGDRFDRPRPRGWYARRGVRDARSAPRQVDHPTPQQQRELVAQQERHPPRGASRREDASACECGVECLLLPGCSPACACQCEPARGATPHTVTP